MKLRTKFIILFISVFLAFLIIDYSIQQSIVAPSFVELEKNEAKQNLDRCLEAIRREINHLDTLCHDWAAWDNTYKFVEEKNSDYLISSINFNAMKSSNVNILYIVNRKNEIIWGKAFDLALDAELRLKLFSRDNFADTLSYIQYPKSVRPLSKVRKTGFLVTENGLLMLSSRPVLTTSNAGPSRGTMIMGRFFTKTLSNKLKNQTKVNFNIISRATDSTMFKRIQSGFTDSQQYLEKEKRSNILIYSSVLAMDKKQAFFIEIIFPKKITQKGFMAMNYASVISFFAGFFTLLATLIMVQKTILRPISSLTKKTALIEKGNFSVRFSINRKDEIGTLANRFDHLLANIESKTIELETANSELEILSTTDGLTGLENRRSFDNSLISEWKRNQRDKQYLSIILCDVDCFKKFNDTYGHQMGDDCLISIGRSIKKCLRRPADRVFRYGGEEFVILLPNTNPDGAMIVAESIRVTVENKKTPHKTSDVTNYITISLGVFSIVPQPLLSHIDFVSYADKALYKAKEQGRNKAVFFREFQKPPI